MIGLCVAIVGSALLLVVSDFFRDWLAQRRADQAYEADKTYYEEDQRRRDENIERLVSSLKAAIPGWNPPQREREPDA